MGRFKKKRQLLMEDSRVIDWIDIGGQRIQLGARDPAAIGKPLQANQQRIPSECRRGRIRRVSESKRTKRKDLPHSLTRGG